MKMSKRQYGLTALMFAFLCVAGYFAVNRYVVTSQLRDFTHQETANSVDDNQNASGTSQSAPIHLISDEMVAACSGSEAKVLKAMQANRAKCPARAAVTERGGERVETTSRDPKRRTYATSSYRLEQLDGGAWFPVEIDQQSFTPDTGKIQNRNQYQITRSGSAFGTKAQIDKGVFELTPWKDLIAKPGADSNSKNIQLDKLDSAPARECRALIKRLDDDGEVQLAAAARERLAKRWKGITEQPAASFARQPTAKDPDVSGAFVQIQTELDGIWSNSKGTVEDWTDRIIGKQADYRTDRLKLLFEAAQGPRQRCIDLRDFSFSILGSKGVSGRTSTTLRSHFDEENSSERS